MLNLTNLTHLSSNHCYPDTFNIHRINLGVFFVTILCLLTLFTNLYVLLTILMNKKLHVIINFFFVSSSITGIIVAVLNIPFETVYVVHGGAMAFPHVSSGTRWISARVLYVLTGYCFVH